jgi:hypothetical protein
MGALESTGVAGNGVPSLAYGARSLKLHSRHGALHFVVAVYALVGPYLGIVALKGLGNTARKKSVAAAVLAASRQCKSRISDGISPGHFASPQSHRLNGAHTNEAGNG